MMRAGVIAGIFIALIVSCTRGPAPVAQVLPREAAGLIQNDFAVLVDVREEPEVKGSGIAAPARWFPRSKIKAADPSWTAFLGSVSKDKQVILYGDGSDSVAADLAAQGYRAGVMGDLADWKGAGLPTQPAP